MRARPTATVAALALVLAMPAAADVAGTAPATPGENESVSLGRLVERALREATAGVAKAAVVGTPAASVAPGGFRSDALVGLPVLDAEQATVGRTKALLISPAGTVDAVIVDVGGVFGVGARSVAIPWDRIRFAAGATAVEVAVVDLSASELGQLPALDEGSDAPAIVQ